MFWWTWQPLGLPFRSCSKRLQIYNRFWNSQEKNFIFFQCFRQLVSSWKRMQTYNLFLLQNKQNFNLFFRELFCFSLYPCWVHNSWSCDHLLRLKAAANLQPFFNSFQKKFQIFFRERFASRPRLYWTHNSHKPFVVSLSGCKYTPVFQSRKFPLHLCYGLFKLRASGLENVIFEADYFF